MYAKKFQDQVKSLFHAQFPNGYCHISKLALGGGVHIKGGLISDLMDQTNGIRDNDPMALLIFIHEDIVFNDETEQLGSLVVEFDMSGISVRPDADNKHLFCQTRKIPARKIKGDAEKTLKRLDTYFKRCKEVVTEEAEAGNIIKQDQIDSKYL